MDRTSDAGKIRQLSTRPPLNGQTLVVALSRTREPIEVRDRYGLTRMLPPSDCMHLVCNSEGYIGVGSKRRIRSIVYVAPKPRVVPIHDSGFCGFNRYPLPDESTVQHRKCRTADIDFFRRAA